MLGEEQSGKTSPSKGPGVRNNAEASIAAAE